MESETAAVLLREHAFTKGFWPDHIVRLAAMAAEVRFQPGELVFHEGDRSSVLSVMAERLHATRVQLVDIYSPVAV